MRKAKYAVLCSSNRSDFEASMKNVIPSKVEESRCITFW